MRAVVSVGHPTVFSLLLVEIPHPLEVPPGSQIVEVWRSEGRWQLDGRADWWDVDLRGVLPRWFLVFEVDFAVVEVLEWVFADPVPDCPDDVVG